MLIRRTVSSYKHFDLGQVKVAFTQVCAEELFQDVYFSANAVYHVIAGSAALRSAQGTIRLGKGEVALIAQHSKLDIRKWKDADGSDFCSVIFYLFPDHVKAFVKANGAADVPGFTDGAQVIALGADGALGELMRSLTPLFSTTRPERAVIQEKTLRALELLSASGPQFIAFLARNNRPIKIDLYEFMIHVTLYGHSVAELAQLTGRSLSAFKREFADIFGTTPHQWLLQQRIDQAERILKEQGMKASDIYHMLGFKELSHFSAAFKKQKGFSPTQLSR